MALSDGRARSGRILLATELKRQQDIRLFRRELRHALGGLAIERERLDDFILAVNEAVANVFRHAYRDRGDGGPCRVRVVRQPDGIAAMVEDDGDGFDPRQGYETQPAGESGRGFAIIRALVDELDCDVTETGGGHIEMRVALT